MIFRYFWGDTSRSVERPTLENVNMPLHSSNPNCKKRTPPPDETFEEPNSLKSLGEKQKVVSLKLADGEVVRGWIEYYDKNMVRVTREDGPNLFIFKHEIVYIAEDGKKK